MGIRFMETGRWARMRTGGNGVWKKNGGRRRQGKGGGRIERREDEKVGGRKGRKRTEKQKI